MSALRFWCAKPEDNQVLAHAAAQVSDTLRCASWSGAAEGVRHLFEMRRGRGTFADARAGRAPDANVSDLVVLRSRRRLATPRARP
jgi:hypothetical protein